MAVWEGKEYKVFELFAKRWALVTAGNMDHFNSCTVGWGSLGTIWGRPGSGGSIVTVYLHPARYTRDVMLESDHFTVSFFPEKYRGALGIMGSRSGRDHDKVSESGLTPVAFGSSAAVRPPARISPANRHMPAIARMRLWRKGFVTFSVSFMIRTLRR